MNSISKSSALTIPGLFFGKKQTPTKNIAALKNVRTQHSTLLQANTTLLWASYGLIALNVLVIFSYIFGVNNYASEGYQIKTIQNRITAQNEINNKLTQKISEHSSIVSIQNDFTNSNFVPAGTVKYLSSQEYTQR